MGTSSHYAWNTSSVMDPGTAFHSPVVWIANLRTRISQCKLKFIRHVNNVISVPIPKSMDDRYIIAVFVEVQMIVYKNRGHSDLCDQREQASIRWIVEIRNCRWNVKECVTSGEGLWLCSFQKRITENPCRYSMKSTICAFHLRLWNIYYSSLEWVFVVMRHVHAWLMPDCMLYKF